MPSLGKVCTGRDVPNYATPGATRATIGYRSARTDSDAGTQIATGAGSPFFYLKNYLRLFKLTTRIRH